MSESLFLINPRRRKRKSRKGRMPPALKKYWAEHRRGGKKRRRKVRVKHRMANPHRRRRHRARRRNPRRRRAVYHRRRRKVYVAHHRRRNPARAHRRRHHRRRNPFGSGEIQSVVLPALYGAGGAIGVSILYGYLSPYLPSMLTTGFAPTLAQAAVALGAGYLVGRFMGQRTGNLVAVGAVTVIAANALSGAVAQAAPSLPGVSGLGGLRLGGVGDYIPYRRPIGAYMPGKVQATGRPLGFISPAPRIGAYSPSMRRGVGAYMRGFVSSPAPDMSGGSGYTGMHDQM